MLAEDQPTIRAVNPRTWLKKTDYREQDFRRSLRVFTKQRADLMKVLDPLDADAWSRSATVTGAGAVLERTVLVYAQWMARHEKPHVKQIETIVTTLRV
jgi:hypothetical protein